MKGAKVTTPSPTKKIPRNIEEDTPLENDVMWNITTSRMSRFIILCHYVANTMSIHVHCTCTVYMYMILHVCVVVGCMYMYICTYMYSTTWLWFIQAVQVLFDGSSRRVKSITNKVSKITVNVDQGFYWYNSSAGNNVNSTQASGTYIFRWVKMCIKSLLHVLLYIVHVHTFTLCKELSLTWHYIEWPQTMLFVCN